MKVKLGIVEFDADLKELLGISELLKSNLKRKHRRELKKLLEEVNKIYGIIVEAFIAFEGISYTDPDFTKSFKEKRAAFDKQYKMDKKNVEFRCTVVKKLLDKLTGPGVARKIVTKITGKQFPEEDYLDESRLKFRRHVRLWYTNDRKVYWRLENLQMNLLAGLDEINDILETKEIDQANQELQVFIKESRSEFDEMRELVAKLNKLSIEL